MKKILGVNLIEFLWIVFGSASLAGGIAWFANPFGLVIGGVSGASIVIAAIFRNIFGIFVPIGLLHLLINVPIFIMSWIQSGFEFIKKSLIGMLLLSFWLYVFEMAPNPFAIQDDTLIASVLCGVFSGFGLAFVLRTGATTGGTDMLAAFIHKIIPYVSFSVTVFLIDAIIIFSGIFVFGFTATVYAAISVFVSSCLINAVSNKIKFTKAVFVFSDKTEEISKQIFKQLDRGNTGISARGMYSGIKKEALYVVVTPKELPRLKKLILDVDKKAFITICTADETVGEGFLDGDKEYII